MSWFQKKPEPGQEIARELAELETLAERASSGYQAQYWLRAGDLCVRSGRPKKALVYFGRALDTYLETGRLDAADALCRRMLDAVPDAVRVRSTLLWVTAARGPAVAVREAIDDYVRVGVARNQAPLVVHQLRLLGEASEEIEVREALAEALLGLGADQEADRLFGQALAVRNGVLSSAPTLLAHEWGERMLEATLLRPEAVLETLGAAA